MTTIYDNETKQTKTFTESFVKRQAKRVCPDFSISKRAKQTLMASGLKDVNTFWNVVELASRFAYVFRRKFKITQGDVLLALEYNKDKKIQSKMKHVLDKHDSMIRKLFDKNNHVAVEGYNTL